MVATFLAGVRSSLLLVLTGVALLGLFPKSALGAWTFTDSGFYTETLVTLPQFTPVGLAWAPDGRMFIWTKSGVVRVFKQGSLLPTPFLDFSSKVNIVNDRGLLGLAFDPNFSSNGYIYLVYVYEEGGNPSSTSRKVSLLTRVRSDPANPDVMLPGSETIILGSTNQIPCPAPGPTVNCIPSDDDSHAVGTIRFGADGTLWLGNGDAASYNFADPLALRAQNLDSFAGKIIRINPDGTAPTSPPNPFFDGTNSVRSKIWAYGLRNPYRFTLHPTTGIPYTGDVGWNTWEEINKVVGGGNFGWPCYEGVDPQPDYRAAFSQCSAANLPSSAVVAPMYYYLHDAQGGATAIAGPVYQGSRYATQYVGNLFITDYVSRWIRRVILDASGNLQSVQPFASNIGTSLGGLVSLELGPDGYLYYVEITTGAIGRIRHVNENSGNLPPTAVASAMPQAGLSPLQVTFNGSGSTDPEGLPLSYSWDFGDGGTSTAANPVHTYTSVTVQTIQARLTVTDSAAQTSNATIPVTIGSRPPVVSIATPPDLTTLTIGSTVNYLGSAVDPDEGALPPSRLQWTILLHHNTHAHVADVVTGSGGSFVVEDHDPQSTFAYELILSATDSSGLTGSDNVVLPVFNPLSQPEFAYALDETSGTTAVDATGKGHTGTLANGPTWGTGRFGGGLTLDGVNDFVSVAGASTIDLGSGDFTIMMWLKRIGVGGSSQQHLFAKCDSTTWTNGCKELYLYGDILRFGSYGTGDTNSVSILDANWHHLAVVFTRSTNALQIYLDGSVVTNATKALELDAVSHVVTLGGMHGANPFSGTIDDVRFYRRAVSGGEILTAMNTPVAPVVDTTAPVVSNGQPTGVLAAGTVQATLQVTTNEAATCRYGTTAGVVYGSQPNVFTTTGGTSHATVVSGLANGQSYTYYVRCQDAVGNATTSDFAISFSVAAPDAIPPTVSLTAPADGATVSGTVAVTASASDDIGVAGVQFLLDGANLGAEVTQAPYSVSWNTTTASNGAHSLTARARDAAGNQTTSTVRTVTVSNTVPTGLVMALGLNETSGTTAADASGNGHPGTLQNGPVWVAGRYGNGLSFDGTNDNLSIAGPSTIGLGSGDFTIMMWIKRNATGGGQRHLFAKCDAVNWASGCKEFYFAGNTLRFGSYATSDVNSVRISDTNWHHVAVVFTRATNALQIYTDGVLRTTATRNLEADGAAHVVTVGNMHGANPFSGVIDEVRVYSRALTAGEVTTAMNAPI